MSHARGTYGPLAPRLVTRLRAPILIAVRGPHRQYVHAATRPSGRFPTVTVRTASGLVSWTRTSYFGSITPSQTLTLVGPTCHALVLGSKINRPREAHRASPALFRLDLPGRRRRGPLGHRIVARSGGAAAASAASAASTIAARISASRGVTTRRPPGTPTIAPGARAAAADDAAPRRRRACPPNRPGASRPEVQR